jgi:hypothetical protein
MSAKESASVTNTPDTNQIIAAIQNESDTVQLTLIRRAVTERLGGLAQIELEAEAARLAERNALRARWSDAVRQISDDLYVDRRDPQSTKDDRWHWVFWDKMDEGYRRYRGRRCHKTIDAAWNAAEGFAAKSRYNPTQPI